MTRTRPWPLLTAAALAACVSLEEKPLVKDAVRPGQRTVVVVYLSPAPVMNEKSTNLEQAAKIVPGLSFVLGATQNERDLDASKDLAQALPPGPPDLPFYPVLLQELGAVGYPGRFVPAAEAGLPADALQGLNAADDVIAWQSRYRERSADASVPRDYSKFPALRDDLVLEINLGYGAPSDGSGKWTPALSAVTKLYRASPTQLLWRHESAAEDAAGTRPSAEFKKDTADLIVKWRGLLPVLAKTTTAALQKALQDPGPDKP